MNERGHAAGKGDGRRGKERERENIDPSWDSNHTPSAILVDVPSQLD